MESKFSASLKWFFAFVEDESASWFMNPGNIRDNNVVRKSRKNKRFEWWAGRSNFHQLMLLVCLALTGKLDSAISRTQRQAWVSLQSCRLNTDLCDNFRKWKCDRKKDKHTKKLVMQAEKQENKNSVASVKKDFEELCRTNYSKTREAIKEDALRF